MYNLFIVFFSCIIVTTANDPKKHPNYHGLPHPPECSNPYGSDRIVDGDFAAMGQFPWMARLGYILLNCPSQSDQPIFNCAGSLIASKFVLTAGHCAELFGKRKCLATAKEEKALLNMVRLGDYDLTKSIDCEEGICADAPQDILIERIARHEHFNSSFLHNDVAVLELKSEAKISAWVNPICLPFGDVLFTNYTNTMALVAGWGQMSKSTAAADVNPDVLKCIFLPVLQISDCTKHFPMINRNGSQLCVGGEKGQDSCAGDSGGPLMTVATESGTPREYQIGLVSFGNAVCGTEGVPAVYTDIRFYIDWILDHLNI